ncbi:MAG: hypothetical protein KY450_11435 [Actinobacteria bacterium]|nr:hypothetical protein [Actinomycetota bacterium]
MALGRSGDVEALQLAAEWARPVALAGEHLLPVLAPLTPLLVDGGLRRGSTISVEGAPGATTLAMALGAAASAAGSWVAAVGLPALGLSAAAELGVVLERMVVVTSPPARAWATVVAALVDAVELVWVGLPRRVAAGDARRLAARARERGSVLVPVAARGATSARSGASGGWPQPADVRLVVRSSAWAGLAGDGAGRLEARRAEVGATGRGAATRERRVALWLPGPDGRVAPVDPPVLCRFDPMGRGPVDEERQGGGEAAG